MFFFQKIGTYWGVFLKGVDSLLGLLGLSVRVRGEEMRLVLPKGHKGVW